MTVSPRFHESLWDCVCITYINYPCVVRYAGVFNGHGAPQIYGEISAVIEAKSPLSCTSTPGLVVGFSKVCWRFLIESYGYHELRSTTGRILVGTKLIQASAWAWVFMNYGYSLPFCRTGFRHMFFRSDQVARYGPKKIMLRGAAQWVRKTWIVASSNSYKFLLTNLVGFDSVELKAQRSTTATNSLEYLVMGGDIVTNMNRL